MASPTKMNLTYIEKLELQNIMYRMQLKNERLSWLEKEHHDTKIDISDLNEELNRWNKKFNKKLKKNGLSIENVNIDAETGEVEPCTPLKVVNE